MENRPRPGRGLGLRGRNRECAVLDDSVSAVRRGESCTLVLRGEAGVGKTALLEHLLESASQMTVLRAGGVESEMELAYAGLHQLCGPLLDRVDRLPAPQRQALEIVFGERAGYPPDRFLVGLAVLSLFCEATDESPLLCVVDDAQWLDRTSVLTLVFVARRLLAEPVGIVFAAREPGDELRGLTGLEVRGLRNDDAHALLSSAVPSILDEQVRDRIVAETRGNPLALLELASGQASSQFAGGLGGPATQALPRRIEESFVGRFEVLPDQTRLLLLVAAAEPTGDPQLLWRASEQLGTTRAAVEAADADGLLEVGERVTFRHPLVRSAIYRSADPEERRTAHRTLAEATDAELDPDRHVWHRAAAAPGPDEAIASELEQSATRTQARGGLAAAAAIRERSAALTPDPAQRARRTLSAARASLHAGAFDAAARLLGAVDTGALNELRRGYVELLRGQIASASSPGGEAAGQLLKSAQRLETLDVGLAREAYLEAWGAAMFASALASGGNLLDVSREAASAPRPSGSSLAADLLLDGLAALMAEGRAPAAPILSDAVSAFLSDETSVVKGFRSGVLVSMAAVVLWDVDSWDAILTRQMQLAREAGALTDLLMVLTGSGVAVSWQGDLPRATLMAAEADALTEVTGTGIGPYGALLLAGLQGRETSAVGLINGAIKEAEAGGEGLAVEFADLATAVLYNGLGQYDKALAAARRASEGTPELLVSSLALPELVVAASRTGNDDLAAEALGRLAESTSIVDSDWGVGILARSRALLGDGELAEASHLEAIERLGRSKLRPDLARSHLHFGQWLRRENRRTEAREQLRRSHQMFTEIGMEAFAERAREELAATGEQVRKRTVEARDDLTPQETRIAQLARDGFSNPEIGSRLFLSPRTIEWHLHKVFAKLEISSRRELATAALPGVQAEPASS
jgi:DNA-binding CsgD family transcriptional regulator